MLLAYMHRLGNEARPELCLLADKPDQYSVPVSVESLVETNFACIRLGPHEAVLVKHDSSDNSLVLNPVIPAKFYLTPSLPDRPGVEVRVLKVLKREETGYEVYFQQEKDKASGEWHPWHPDRQK